MSNWLHMRLYLVMICMTVSIGCGNPPSSEPQREIFPSVDLGMSDAGDAVIRPPAVRFNSLRPTILPLAGGALTLIGQQMEQLEEVSLDGVLCELDSERLTSRAKCRAASFETPGVATLFLRWSDGHSETYEDIVTLFAPLVLSEIQPARVNASLGAEILIVGAGFVEGMTARIGDLRVPLAFESDTQVRARVPRMVPGVYDVSLQSPYESATLENALILEGPLSITSINPSVGSVDGGILTTISGIGLLPQSTVFFGSEMAEVTVADPESQALQVRVPPAPSTQVVDVRVQNVLGDAVYPNAFVYVDESLTEFDVLGLFPNRLEVNGSQEFDIIGHGLSSSISVSIESDLLECVLADANRLRCQTGVRLPGTYTVSVRNPMTDSEFQFSLILYTVPQFFEILPPQGFVSGGTLIEVVGRDFESDTQLSFDGLELSILEQSDDRIFAMTPPGALGFTALGIRTEFAQLRIPDAFEYVDSRDAFGGVSGSQIVRNVTVAAFDADTRRPIPDATVVVTDAQNRFRFTGETDERGALVASGMTLEAPLTTTVGHPDYTSTTVERVVTDVVNVTLFAKQPPEGDGEQEAPVMPIVRGEIVGMRDLEKPIDPDWVLVCLVETSHPFPNGAFGAPVPTLAAVLVEDGPFELTTRAGQFGLIATAGLVPSEVFDAFREQTVNFFALKKELEPISMGYTAFLTAHYGDELDDVTVAVDRPRTGSSSVRFDNPPGAGASMQGPNHYGLSAFLDLGADGFFDLGVDLNHEVPEFTAIGLPMVDEWPEPYVRLRWEGEAYVLPNETVQNSRISWVKAERERVNSLEVIGPFIPTTEVVSPRIDTIIDPAFQVRWSLHEGISPNQAQETADLNYLSLSNQEGLLWQGWLPGAVTNVTLPLNEPPLAEQILPVNAYQLTIFAAQGPEGFSFDDFNFAQIGEFQAYSWSYTTFTDGDLETVESNADVNDER